MRKNLRMILTIVTILALLSSMAVAESAVTEAGSFPIVNEPITLKALVVQDGMTESFEDNYYTNWLEAKSGINLEFEEVTSSNAAEKLQIMLAGNNYPDIIFGVGSANTTVLSTTNILKYGEDGGGQLIALNDYIEQYGINIKALFQKHSAGTSLEQMMTSADVIFLLMVLLF